MAHSHYCAIAMLRICQLLLFIQVDLHHISYYGFTVLKKRQGYEFEKITDRPTAVNNMAAVS